MFDPAANVAAYTPIFNEAALNAGKAARQNALADISQQYLTDPEGAQNALISRGWWADADTMQKRTDASNLADAYETAAANAPKGQNPGVTALIGAGQPGQAVNLQNSYNSMANSATNAANTAEDRKTEAEKNVISEFSNIARDPNLTPDQWNKTLDLIKSSHPQYAGGIEQYRDFDTGLPLLRGRLGVKPSDVTNQQSQGGRAGAVMAQAQAKAQEFLSLHPEYMGREKEVLGKAVTAVQAQDDLAAGEDGSIGLAGLKGSRAAQRQQMADAASARINPDIQREVAEYRDLGKRDGALAQRKSIAGGALNHLETVSQISDGELQNALGVIQGEGGYQKFLDLVKSGRIEDSVAYHNAKQTLAVLLRETQNAYHIAGTGADTDARMQETKDALSPDSLLQSPNIQVFRQRLSNIRAILQGVVNSPRPSSFGSRSPNTSGSAAAEEEVRRVSGAPEASGQVQRPEAHAIMNGKNYVKRNGQWFEE